MFAPSAFRTSPDEFSRRLDEAKARAAVLRQEAVRELGSSLFAAAAGAGRRIVRAARAARLQAHPATHPTR
jgi:hypothetical protein